MAQAETQEEFLAKTLHKSTYIVALLSAGLSASSGIPTISGSGATWRGYESRTLATREAFQQSPCIVSEYYREFQRRVASAAPNRGHLALAELAKAKPGFLAITQNIDDLSQRAGHPPNQLAPLHGSVFSSKCFNESCNYYESYSSTDTHALAVPPVFDPSTANVPLSASEVQYIPNPPICTLCHSAYVRPGVVWHGELLPLTLLDELDSWIDSVPRLEVMLVVGTMATLSRSAEFIDRARERGAVVAHFNIKRNEELLEDEDLFFRGDAAYWLSKIIGEVLGIGI